MTTLAAVLVRQRTAPLETVEQAMLRQSLFGGDLATNLLELRSIAEGVLLEAVSAALECAPLGTGCIGETPRELRDAVPLAVLEEHLCVPVRVENGTVILAAATPLDEATLLELSRKFGRPVAPRATLEPRIRQALALYYGGSLDMRTAKLLARLDGIPYESVVPPNPFPEESPTSQVPTPRVSLSPLLQQKTGSSVAPAKSRRGRRLGPFTAAMAESELSAAKTPAALIDVWLSFASQYFDYTAVFAVQGDLAAGKQARGNGTTGEPFSRIGVPLDLPNILEAARKSSSWVLAALSPRGLDRTLARDLGRTPGPQVVVLPIALRGRAVLLTYGDQGDEDVELEQVGDVLAMRPLVERHLERLMVERKRSRSMHPSPPRKVEATPSTAPASPVAAADAQGAAVDAQGATTASKGGAAGPTAVPHEQVGSDTSEDHAIPSDLPTAPSHAPMALAAFDFDPHQGETLRAPAGQLHDALGHAPSRVETDTSDLDDNWDLVAQPVVSVGELPRDVRAPAVPPPARPPSSPPAAPWPSNATRPGFSPKLELMTESDSAVSNLRPSPDEAVSAASRLPSRTDSHAALAPLPEAQSQEQQLPTVVVDYERDCLELVERWTKGDAAALDQLVAMGDIAIGILVREMPGPVTSTSRRGDQIVKASECGPVLRALVAFGPAARPYVIARTSDGDPKVRAWAIRLLGELGGRPSAMAVAQRVVLDREPEVRRAAHQSSQLLYRDPDSAEALRQSLLQTAADRRAVITQRLAAIDALSDLRDTQAIPHLIELLVDPNPATAAGAQQALVVLTRQDHGYEVSQWNAWWQANGRRDRIEWMIDALEHRQSGIRQAAAEELRLLSRLYVGDLDDDSAEARARVQKKYRDWWTGRKTPSSAPKP